MSKPWALAGVGTATPGAAGLGVVVPPCLAWLTVRWLRVQAAIPIAAATSTITMPASALPISRRSCRGDAVLGVPRVRIAWVSAWGWGGIPGPAAWLAAARPADERGASGGGVSGVAGATCASAGAGGAGLGGGGRPRPGAAAR